VLRAAGETETTQENIRDWLQLDEGDPGFQLLTQEETALPVLLNSPIICFLPFRAIFCSTNPDDLSPHLIRISEGLLYFTLSVHSPYFKY
jgi:hypothetical protein